MAAFTSEQKYGYFDGEHVGNWSSIFPIFARVVNGQAYLVGREDDPAKTSRFGKMYFLSREWMRGAIFNGSPSDADYFIDKPNQTEDTSMPGNLFNKTNNTAQVISRPDPSAVPELPYTTNPVNNVPPASVNPTGTTTPATTTPAATTTTGTVMQTLTDGVTSIGTVTSKLSTTTIVLIGVVVVGAIAAVVYFMKQKK